MQYADTLRYGDVCYTQSRHWQGYRKFPVLSTQSYCLGRLVSVHCQAPGKAQVHCISCVSSWQTKCQGWVVVGKIVTVFLCYHLMRAGM